jgi:prepilin-type N-terminal cleavage/methylation domain-containing protein
MKKTARDYLRGFTLVELLVSVGIIAVLIVALILVLNPYAQLQKFWNSQRKSDLDQIKNALDTYYNDYGCYPTSVPFGIQWLNGQTMLMKKVPQDPSVYCKSDSECYPYAYITDTGTDCPQWSVVFARLYGTSSQLQTTSTSTCSYTNPSTGQTSTLAGQQAYKCDSCPIFQNCGTTVLSALSKYNYCKLLGGIDSSACTIINTVNFVPRSSFTTTTISSPTTTGGGSTTTTSVTSTTTTTTVPCDNPCNCSEATTYWGALGYGVSCQALPPGNIPNCGTENYPCYCSGDCSGCPCVK